MSNVRAGLCLSLIIALSSETHACTSSKVRHLRALNRINAGWFFSSSVFLDDPEALMPSARKFTSDFADFEKNGEKHRSLFYADEGE
jgi:hypothetical protein